MVAVGDGVRDDRKDILVPFLALSSSTYSFHVFVLTPISFLSSAIKTFLYHAQILFASPPVLNNVPPFLSVPP